MKCRTLLATLVALGLPAVVAAQQERNPDPLERPGTIQRDVQQPGERPAPPTGERREAGFRGTDAQGQQDANMELVHYLAAKLMLANQCQTELSEKAANQAQNPQVKEFAQEVAQEHQRINQQLKQAVPGLASIQGVTSSDRQANQPGRSGEADRTRGEAGARETQPRATADARQPGAGASGQILDGAAKELLNIERQAVETHKQMLTQMLQEKQGQEFDMCYVGHEIGAHMWMLAELQAIQQSGPPQLAEIAGQAERAVEQHLETAKQLASTMMKESSGRSAQPGTRTSDRPQQQN